MTTHVLPSHLQRFEARELSQSWPWTRALVPIGRVFLALIFVLSGLGHFSSGTIRYAASAGVPAAGVLVPLAGILAIAGGLSVATGFWARIGALLLVVFLVPVTLTMHAFWAVSDPMMRQIQQLMFLKNVSMLGGALLLMYFGAGPISFDAPGERPGERAPVA